MQSGVRVAITARSSACDSVICDRGDVYYYREWPKCRMITDIEATSRLALDAGDHNCSGTEKWHRVAWCSLGSLLRAWTSCGVRLISDFADSLRAFGTGSLHGSSLSTCQRPLLGQAVEHT